MNADDITESRIRELAKIGIHTKYKEIMMQDPKTGKMVAHKALVLDHADGPSLGAATALKEDGKWTEKERAYFESIPGLMDLRKQFFTEIASIQGCTGCKRGALLKKYMPRVMLLLGNDPNNGSLNPWRRETTASEKETDNENTGTGEVSTPAGESAGGAASRKSLLRRAAEGIAKIFRASKKVG